MIQSVERALELLEAMNQPQKDFTLAELSAAVRLPPSTTHRILQTLCKKNYAVRDNRAHLYSLGSALIPLGVAASQNLDLKGTAMPILQRLSAQAREDSFLVILSGYRGIVLCHEDGPCNLKIVDKLGQEVELHCGALRKALLAYQDGAFIQNYLSHCQQTFCSHPIIDASALLAELKTIRQQGVAFTCSEYLEGAVGIGAPVFDAHGQVHASLGIVLPLSRAADALIPSLKQTVKQFASELSTCLGAPPSGCHSLCRNHQGTK